MCDSTGLPMEDPIELQHKQDDFEESRQAKTLQDQAQQGGEHTAEV